MGYVIQGLGLEPCHSPKEGQPGIHESRECARGLWKEDWCVESHCGALAQGLHGGNPEAESACRLVTSVHRVSTGET